MPCVRVRSACVLAALQKMRQAKNSFLATSLSCMCVCVYMLRGLPGAARVLKGLNATRARGLGPAGFVPAHRLRSTAAENSSAAVTTSQSFPVSPPWQRVKYAELEVWDSAELVALSAHLVSERARLHEVYRVAKLEQRKVAAAERRRETSCPPPSRLTCTPPPPRPRFFRCSGRTPNSTYAG